MTVYVTKFIMLVRTLRFQSDARNLVSNHLSQRSLFSHQAVLRFHNEFLEPGLFLPGQRAGGSVQGMMPQGAEELRHHVFSTLLKEQYLRKGSFFCKGAVSSWTSDGTSVTYGLIVLHHFLSTLYSVHLLQSNISCTTSQQPSCILMTSLLHYNLLEITNL